MPAIEPKKIGTVDLLVQRIYPLDNRSPYKNEGTWVIVEPGTYDVYREMDAFYAMWRGRATARGLRKMGDGLFFGQEGDEPVGLEHVFSSMVWGPEQFREFVGTDPICQLGPNQRMRWNVPEAEMQDPEVPADDDEATDE